MKHRVLAILACVAFVITGTFLGWPVGMIPYMILLGFPVGMGLASDGQFAVRRQKRGSSTAKQKAWQAKQKAWQSGQKPNWR